MKTRLLTAGVVLCLLAMCGGGSLFAQDVESTVISIEKTLWEAWKNRQPEAFRENLTENSVNITTTAFSSGKEEIIKDLTTQPCDVRSFSLSNWQFHQVTDDTVMLTYRAKQDATCQGNKLPAEVMSSAVYVKKNGKWLAAMYAETATTQNQPVKTE